MIFHLVALDCPYVNNYDLHLGSKAHPGMGHRGTSVMTLFVLTPSGSCQPAANPQCAAEVYGQSTYKESTRLRVQSLDFEAIHLFTGNPPLEHIHPALAERKSCCVHWRLSASVMGDRGEKHLKMPSTCRAAHHIVSFMRLLLSGASTSGVSSCGGCCFKHSYHMYIIACALPMANKFLRTVRTQECS